jgi:hypothetical protein
VYKYEFCIFQFELKLLRINGVVVTSIVAIDRPRVRFAVNANFFVLSIAYSCFCNLEFHSDTFLDPDIPDVAEIEYAKVFDLALALV